MGDEKSNPPPAANGARPRGPTVPPERAKEVQKIALDALPPRQRVTSNLYMDRWHVPAGTKLGTSFENWLVERDSILCFVDHQPLANFAHPCAYFLHDARSGELFAQVPAQFPPYPREGIHLMEPFHRGVALEPLDRPVLL
jgi:hypothetical protein